MHADGREELGLLHGRVRVLDLCGEGRQFVVTRRVKRRDVAPGQEAVEDVREHEADPTMTQPRPAPQTLTLRGYQEEAIDGCRRVMARGQRRVCLVMPTGSGKTRTAAAVVAAVLDRGKRVLWLAHRAELVEQACATLEGFGMLPGVAAASSARQTRPEAPCQVASIQTLVARETHRPPADLIIWDECHHASEAAECWSGLLDAYPRTRMIGLTATPERGDGAGLAPLFDGLVVGTSVRALTEAGHLVPYEILRPERMLDAGQVAQDPVRAYLDHAGGRQGILFARNVEEAQRYAAALGEAGSRSECVSATTPTADREAAIELFRRGVVRVLTNVYVMTEGTDLPMAAVCVLARGAASAGIAIQMVGRVLRPAPGKTSALILDLRGITHSPRIGLPDDERVYSLEGRGIRLATERHCQVCSAPIESYPCAACGYCPTQGDAAETEVMGLPLVKFARMRAQGEDERRATLHRWVRDALGKGYKPASVRYKWRAVYSEELDMRRLMLAVQEVRNGQ